MKDTDTAKGFLAPVSSRGQMTLPRAVRALLHVDRGDYVRFAVKGMGVMMTKLSLESEEFSEREWKALERLANQKGKRSPDATSFLKDLDRL